MWAAAADFFGDHDGDDANSDAASLAVPAPSSSGAPSPQLTPTVRTRRVASVAGGDDGVFVRRCANEQCRRVLFVFCDAACAFRASTASTSSPPSLAPSSSLAPLTPTAGTWATSPLHTRPTGAHNSTLIFPADRPALLERRRRSGSGATGTDELVAADSLARGNEVPTLADNIPEERVFLCADCAKLHHF